MFVLDFSSFLEHCNYMDGTEMTITAADVRKYMQENDCSMSQAKNALVNVETNKYIDGLITEIRCDRHGSIKEAVIYLLERTRP